MHKNHEDTSVRIYCVNNKTGLPLTFSASDTVHDLKVQISRVASFGNPAVISQRLVFNGITIQDNWRLRPEWIGGTTIYLALDSDGGAARSAELEADILSIRSEIEALRKKITSSRNRTAILEWRNRHIEHNRCPKFDDLYDDV
jgi:hypothetical protein